MQFGFVEKEWEDLTHRLAKLKYVQVVGTHSHVQSQILLTEVAMMNLEFALEGSEAFRVRLLLTAQRKIEFEQVCLGGGFGIPYRESASQFQLDRFAIDFSRLSHSFRLTYPITLLALELGRYLVGERGVFAAKILYLKQESESQALFDTANGGRVASGALTVSVAGPTCYSQDILARMNLFGQFYWIALFYFYSSGRFF